MKITIENIDFNIIKINVSKNIFSPGISENIEIKTTTDNKNYMAIQKLIDNALDINYDKKTYKLYLNYVKIYGVFPIEFTFKQYNIETIFCANFIEGNFKLFNKQLMRKEKLNRINNKINEIYCQIFINYNSMHKKL